MYELESIKADISYIIRELDDIANGINTEFKNIGNDKCADCIYKVSDQYKYVLRQLGNIDTSKVAEGYTAY